MLSVEVMQRSVFLDYLVLHLAAMPVIMTILAAAGGMVATRLGSIRQLRSRLLVGLLIGGWAAVIHASGAIHDLSWPVFLRGAVLLLGALIGTSLPPGWIRFLVGLAPCSLASGLWKPAQVNIAYFTVLTLLLIATVLFPLPTLGVFVSAVMTRFFAKRWELRVVERG